MPLANMSLADRNLKEAIRKIRDRGVTSEQARPVYSDGTQANSLYITGYYAKYDLSIGELPLTTLRPIPWKSAIKEVLWIYQDQSNDLSVLRDKHGVSYWDLWDVGDGTIGARYGNTVRKHKIIDKLLAGLEANPWNRRNVISLWDYEDFESSDGLLPCAFTFMVDVRKKNGKTFLDGTLIQRSNDLLVAHHINAIQYVALQMMIAKHFGWEVGEFNYFVNNLHIYDNQLEQATTLLTRQSSDKTPQLRLTCPAYTNFYDIKFEDFELIGYEPTGPQLKFDLAV